MKGGELSIQEVGNKFCRRRSFSRPKRGGNAVPSPIMGGLGRGQL